VLTPTADDKLQGFNKSASEPALAAVHSLTLIKATWYTQTIFGKIRKGCRVHVRLFTNFQQGERPAQHSTPCMQSESQLLLSNCFCFVLSMSVSGRESKCSAAASNMRQRSLSVLLFYAQHIQEVYVLCSALPADTTRPEGITFAPKVLQLQSTPLT
jgi:hypothetical protein